ncbi:hypothetical protein D9611_007625 [Ephemerocybe angulata]|uniref:Uncharacterized protein n=1 Tax=Ephemerocybe angulata TaxID=980116 RepID=A0A8H5FC28_9AGAR|nr:hypothetical protein D9611_007625 [Tulosesus angulatus]
MRSGRGLSVDAALVADQNILDAACATTATGSWQMDVLPADSPGATSGKTIELAQRALSANQELQYELTVRAEELEDEIREADRLLEALENGNDPKEAEDEIQIPGARRASSLFPLSECLNQTSTLYEEAKKRMEFAALITPRSCASHAAPILNPSDAVLTQHPVNPKQLEALRNAVYAENTKLQAYRTQAGYTLFPSPPNMSNPTHRNTDPVDLERNLDGIDWTIVAEKVTDSSFHEPFTATQCRIKWVGEKHPDIDHSDWPPLETQRLLSILKQDPTKPVDWVELSKQLGTHRTPLSLLSHGHPRQRHYWDHPSDARLLSGVALYGLNNWPLVARHVSPHATPTQALNRYTKSLDPSIKRGAWTPAEDARLRRAVAAAAAGSASASAKLPWVRIAEYVPGRTNDQCNERWTEHLSAAATEGGGKNVWTEEEDERLVELVGSMGKLWKAVSDKIGNGKTGPSCRARFNKLANKSKSSGYGTGTTTPASTSMSGLVALSPIPPTTASATSSQPATTPRELSVQASATPTSQALASTSTPTGVANTQPTTASNPYPQPSVTPPSMAEAPLQIASTQSEGSSTVTPIPPDVPDTGELSQPSKGIGKGKKRARQSDDVDSESQPAPKKQKAGPAARDTTTSTPEPSSEATEGSMSTATATKRPRPRPVAKKNASKVTTSKGATPAPLPNLDPPPQAAIEPIHGPDAVTSPPRRSARVATRSGAK